MVPLAFLKVARAVRRLFKPRMALTGKPTRIYYFRRDSQAEAVPAERTIRLGPGEWTVGFSSRPIKLPAKFTVAVTDDGLVISFPERHGD